MKIAEIDACAQCPWLVWKERPRCGNPEKLGKLIKDTMEVPLWCPLDELVG